MSASQIFTRRLAEDDYALFIDGTRRGGWWREGDRRVGEYADGIWWHRLEDAEEAMIAALVTRLAEACWGGAELVAKKARAPHCRRQGDRA